MIRVILFIVLLTLWIIICIWMINNLYIFKKNNPKNDCKHSEETKDKDNRNLEANKND